MEEKKRFNMFVGIDRGGLEIWSEEEDINKKDDLDDEEFWESEDEEYDDCNLSEKVGRGCYSLISYYETWGLDRYKDEFIKNIMWYKDNDIDWDEDVKKYFIEVFFDGDVEKMKNWKKE